MKSSHQLRILLLFCVVLLSLVCSDIVVKHILSLQRGYAKVQCKCARQRCPSTVGASDGEPKRSVAPSSSDPTAASRGPRVLYSVAAFDYTQAQFFHNLLLNARDWCELGLRVRVDVRSIVPMQWIAAKNRLLHCDTTRQGGSLEVEYVATSPSEYAAGGPKFFTCLHRDDWLRDLESFDYFVYAEDDMDIRATNIRAVLREFAYNKAHNLSHDDSFRPNFIRYELATRGDGERALSMNDFYHRDVLPQHFDFNVNVDGRAYIRVNANARYAASYVLSRDDVRALHARRVFSTRDALPLFNATHFQRPLCAGLEFSRFRMIAVDALPELLVHHQSNKYADVATAGRYLLVDDALDYFNAKYGTARSAADQGAASHNSPTSRA